MEALSDILQQAGPVGWLIFGTAYLCAEVLKTRDSSKPKTTHADLAKNHAAIQLHLTEIDGKLDRLLDRVQ